MALSLIDLFIILGLASLGAFAADAVLCLSHVIPNAWHMTVTLVSGIVAILLLASPIYQRFHFRPLCLPPCPRCHKIPEAYHLVDGKWPRFMLACAECEEPVEIWMCRGISPAETSTGTPSFCLRWPKFIGWWRHIPQQSADGDASTTGST